MKITIQLAAQARAAAGAASVPLELPAGATIEAALRQLAAERGDALGALLFDAQGQLHPWMLVFIGDRQVRELNSKLADGDTLSVLSPISGG